jgi:hypothetical protein
MSSKLSPPTRKGYLNWWQSLLLAVGSTILGVVASYFAMSGSGASGMTPGPSWIMDLFKFAPHALMLFGLLADTFTYNGVYWTSTAVGVAAVAAHGPLETVTSGAFKLFSKLAGRPYVPPAAPLEPTSAGFSGCSVTGGPPGVYAPQSLTVTVSILIYYIMDLLINRGVIDAVGAILVGLVLLGGQTAAISADCMRAGITTPLVVSMVYGFIVGSVGYGIVQGWFPALLPSSVIPVKPLGSGDLGMDFSAEMVLVNGKFVSKDSAEGKAAIANGTALSTSEAAAAVEGQGTLSTGAPGVEASCRA